MGATTAFQELAPKPSAMLWIVCGTGAAPFLLVGMIALTGPPIVVAFGVSFVLLGIGIPAWYGLWLTNTSLLISAGTIGYRDLWGRRRDYAMAEIARIVQLTIEYRSRYGFVPKRALLLVAADGRCLLKIRVGWWNEDVTEALSAATGRDPEYVGMLTAPQADAEFRGAVGWSYAHPSVSMAVTAGIFLGLASLFELYLLSRR